jgi:hypothetical protein
LTRRCATDCLARPSSVVIPAARELAGAEIVFDAIHR